MNSPSRALGGDEHRVAGGDDGDVAETDDADDLMPGADQIVAAAHDITAARDAGAGLVLGRQLPRRRPSADIRPAEAARRDGGLGGALHHGVIDRDLLRPFERGRVETEKAEIGRRPRDRLGRRADHVRRERLQFGAHRRAREDKIAGIPQMAVEQILRGARRIRLLDEGVDRARARSQFDAGPDIAVVGEGRR